MTAFGRKLLSTAILSSALVLHQRRADACSCIAQFQTVCEYAQETTVVLHGLTLSSLVRVSIPALHRLQLLARNSALLEKSINNLAYTNISSDVVSAPESICQNSTRSEQEDINDDVHFTVQIIELYKGESEVPAGEELTFVTGGNSALCGVDLTVGEEYLVGLYPGWNGDELYAQSCGLFRTWSSVTEEERTELESCDFDQSCDLTCGEFQECLIYAEGTTAEEAYCADTCEAGTCGDEQSCSLDEVLCIRDPCPPVAVCTSQVGTCTNGLSGIDGTNDNGSVCCPLECNQCGGSGCGTSGAEAGLGSTACCINGILNTQANCVFTWGAPCVITTDGGGGW